MPVGRNDPCPCGSGKKYKRCCGAVVPINPVSVAQAARQCGTCTVCCDGWVKGTIFGHEMKPGLPCHFRGEGCCSIYERRPVFYERSGERFGFGPREFQIEMLAKLERGERLW